MVATHADTFFYRSVRPQKRSDARASAAFNCAPTLPFPLVGGKGPLPHRGHPPASVCDLAPPLGEGPQSHVQLPWAAGIRLPGLALGPGARGRVPAMHPGRVGGTSSPSRHRALGCASKDDAFTVPFG